MLEDKTRNDLDAARRGVAQSTRVAYFGVQSGEVGIREQGHGEFAGWTAATKACGVGVENVDDLPERATVDAEARMAVGDGEAAHGLEKG